MGYGDGVRWVEGLETVNSTPEVECDGSSTIRSPVGMNIKDPQVHAMARELAARRGTSVTDAVRQALRAELDRSPGCLPEQAALARKEEMLRLLTRCRQLPWPAGLSSADLQANLYNDDGLPS